MAFVNHHQCIILVGEVAYLVQLGYSSIHGEYRIRNNDTGTCILISCQLCFQVGHVIMLVPATARLAQAYTVYYGSMVELIRYDSVILAQQWFEDPAIGIKTGNIQYGIIGTYEFG